MFVDVLEQQFKNLIDSNDLSYSLYRFYLFFFKFYNLCLGFSAVDGMVSYRIWFSKRINFKIQ